MNSFKLKILILFGYYIALLFQIIILWHYTTPTKSVVIEKIGIPPLLYQEMDTSKLRQWTESSDVSLDVLLRASALLPRITQVVRMPTPHTEVFSNYIAPVGLPVIFTDLVSKDVMYKWNWEYIGAKYGHLQFGNVRQGNYTDMESKSGKKTINRVKMTVRDFTDIVTGRREAKENEELVYFAKKGLVTGKEFGKEFGYPPFYGNIDQCFLPPSIWMGMPGTYTQGHFDSKDNFIYQIIGRKRWTIFSPQDHQFLGIVKGRGSLEWSSALATLGTPDEKQFPLYKYANPIQVTLSPGEVMYLPRGWVHAVENLEPAFMLNLWRSGPAEIFKLWSPQAEREMSKNCPSVTA